MRVLPHNPYLSALSSTKWEVPAQKGTHSHSNSTKVNQHALPAQKASRQVRFGSWNDIFKAAAYGTSYGWCALKGLAGGLSVYPADAVLLGGAPVSSVAAGAFVVGDCLEKSNKALRDIFA